MIHFKRFMFFGSLRYWTLVYPFILTRYITCCRWKRTDDVCCPVLCSTLTLTALPLFEIKSRDYIVVDARTEVAELKMNRLLNRTAWTLMDRSTNTVETGRASTFYRAHFRVPLKKMLFQFNNILSCRNDVMNVTTPTEGYGHYVILLSSTPFSCMYTATRMWGRMD